VGQRILNQIYNNGDEGLGIIRNAAHGEDLVRLGADTAIVDIEKVDAQTLADALAGCDAVVFAAGAGPNSGAARKKTVDYGGSVLLAEAAAIAGIRRFVQISAIGVDDPLGDDADESWTAYVEAKRDADTRLRETNLDWTILRPGGLTSDEGTGQVTLGDRVERGSISRDDVAAVVLAVIDDDRTIGRTWELVEGSQDIAAAIDSAVA
jgi:uncharacterized protein YbjT (DUF2867 family)